MSKRKRVAGFAAIVAVSAVVGMLVWLGREGAPRKMFVRTLHAQVDGSALVLWGVKGDDDRWHGRVGMLDAKGREIWAREIPRLRPYDSFEDVTAGSDVVVVKFWTWNELRQTQQNLIAFGRADGRVRWQRVVIPASGNRNPLGTSLNLVPSVPPQIIGDLLVVVDERSPGEPVLLGIETSSGVTRWQQPFPEYGSRPLVLGGRLVIHGLGTTDIYGLATGTYTQLATHGAGCVVDNYYVTAVEEETGFAVVGFRDGDPTSQRMIARSAELLDASDWMPSLVSCGSYEDRAFLLVLEDRGRSEALLVDRQGALQARIALSDPEMQKLESNPLAAPLSGRLSRFTLYLERTTDGGARVVMLDLELGKRAWERPVHPLSHVVRAGDDWILFGRETIYRFDGATGRLEEAMEPKGLMLWMLGADQIANDKLWINDDAGLAVIDARTLAPIVSRGLRIEDVSERERAVFGLPQP